MPRQLRIILIIESSRAYGRGCAQGVATYARNHGPWSILQIERGLMDDIPAWVPSWQGDGVLARIENLRQAKTIERLGLPTVDLRGAYVLPGIAMFDSDSYAIVEAAIEHFRTRGFTHFAYCGFSGVDFSDERSDLFQSILQSKGFQPHIYQPPEKPNPDLDTLTLESHGIMDQQCVSKWIESLPKPLGLMACNDVRGRQVIDACGEQGIKVPEEVAVIGVDNDQVLCNLANPPMSSVEPDTHRIGFEGAAALERMIQGELPPEKPCLIPPRGVATRLSTDILAVEDADVVAALHFIREHTCEGINVSDVLRHVAISRATLDRRFLRLLQRSPKEEIMRVRLNRVKQLLLETDYSLPRIAQLSGFRTTAHLSVTFKSQMKQTPSRFRSTASNRK